MEVGIKKLPRNEMLKAGQGRGSSPGSFSQGWHSQSIRRGKCCTVCLVCHLCSLWPQVAVAPGRGGILEKLEPMQVPFMHAVTWGQVQELEGLVLPMALPLPFVSC